MTTSGCEVQVVRLGVHKVLATISSPYRDKLFSHPCHHRHRELRQRLTLWEFGTCDVLSHRGCQQAQVQIVTANTFVRMNYNSAAAATIFMTPDETVNGEPRTGQRGRSVYGTSCTVSAHVGSF